MDQLFLLPGDLVATRKPMHLATLLGSCVGVCLSNHHNNTAGMNHYLLPEAAPSTDEPGRYGDTSIRQLVKKLFSLDSDPRHYRARIFGGGKVIGHLGTLGDIGNRNIEAARRVLGELGLLICHEDVGGSKGRRIHFNTQTDVIECRTVGVSGQARLVEAKKANIRVLIVDDSAVTRRVLRMGLEGCEGIEVVGEAGNAFEARDQILSLDPDVLSLDIERPEIDGVTFLRQLMKHLPKPVVITSSHVRAGSEMESRARAAGAVEVIDKNRLQPARGLDGIRNVLAPALRRAAAFRPKLK